MDGHKKRKKAQDMGAQGARGLSRSSQ